MYLEYKTPAQQHTLVIEDSYRQRYVGKFKLCFQFIVNILFPIVFAAMAALHFFLVGLMDEFGYSFQVSVLLRFPTPPPLSRRSLLKTMFA